MNTTTAPINPAVQRGINALSVVLCLAIAFLILGPRPAGMAGGMDVSSLPFVNSCLNALTATLLLAGFTAIRTGNITIHKRFMLAAFASSTAFLVSYVMYHWFSQGPTLYTGGYRTLYLSILSSHIVLAALILPLALTTLARALFGAIDSHKKIAPATLGIWLYVSVTGVLIYWMAHT